MEEPSRRRTTSRGWLQSAERQEGGAKGSGGQGGCVQGAGPGGATSGRRVAQSCTGAAAGARWQARGLQDPGCGDVRGMPTPPKGSLDTTGGSKRQRHPASPFRGLFWNQMIDWNRKQVDGKGNRAAHPWKVDLCVRRSQAAHKELEGDSITKA